MLKELTIKNIILIKELKLSFHNGFSVFTGETGAGKSILLDSLALSLGDRANFSFIRQGQDKGEIIAIFTDIKPEIKELMALQMIDVEDEIIIRRVITKEGKSKAFINNVPVTVSFLREIGGMLLDIHGQFDNQKLINPSFHREIIDSFINDKSIIKNVEVAYFSLQQAFNNLNKKKNELIEIEKEREYLEFVLNELQEVNPVKGEEEDLLNKKLIATNKRKITDLMKKLDQFINESSLKDNLLKSISLANDLNNQLQDQQTEEFKVNLEKSYDFLDDSIDNLENIQQDFFDEVDLSQVEERLLTLRSLAKKHNTQIDNLPELMISFKDKLDLLNTGSESLIKLEEDYKNQHDNYIQLATHLRQERIKIAQYVDNKINQELSFLKLGSASFKTDFKDIINSPSGIDGITFIVKTNFSSPWGSLNKIASGGEMARFMLALKIVLSEVSIVSTIILDEIDIGVGGEVAEAIGKRLEYLSEKIQVIIVTHSHQVASRGSYHYKVEKDDINGQETLTLVHLLNYQQRIDEVARMLSGKVITQEAKATALKLIKDKDK